MLDILTAKTLSGILDYIGGSLFFSLCDPNEFRRIRQS
ncbi:MAG: hypothetical protein ACI8P9_002538 [Parasphingorhabdus sp.]|jgi:hypothetical protein